MAITGPPFFAVEIEALLPGSVAVALDPGWNTTPWNALSATPAAIESTGTLFASDLGYRTLHSDPSGVVPYPPLVAEAFAIDRKIALAPGDTSAAWAWGAIQLSNDDRRYDTIAAAWNVDGRPAHILTGNKTWDPDRGIWLDPSYTALTTMFSGLATPWFLDARLLRIPLRDATYWLERPYQTNHYGGTGGYDGNAAVKGQPIPRTRGGITGTGALPVRNITPVRIADTRIIYQYSDGPGTVEELYEGGAAVFTADGDVGDLFLTTAPASGHYQTDDANGAFELGAEPVHAITCDVTGEFPTAGVVTTAAGIARYLLTEDMSLPAANIDVTSFTDAATDFPYTAGVYFGPTGNPDGAAAVSQLLVAFGAKLIPSRDGSLRCFVLRALPGTSAPIAVSGGNIGVNNCVSLIPVQLPATIDPPPYRLRVAWQHNYTVQSSDLSPTATAAQLQFVAAADTYASFSSATVLAQYRRPNDPAPFGGALLVEADAQSVADDLGALWGTRRRLYQAVVPVEIGLPLDLGDVVRLTWPMDDLHNGRLGQIVGDQFRSEDATMTLTVLV